MKVKNGKSIRRLSLRSLQANRKRNFIAIAAIILTTLLFTSLFTVTLSINSGYETYTFRQIGGYCHGTFKDVTEEQAEAIAAHRNVKSAGKRTVVGIITEGVFAKAPAEISFMDENCTEWSYAVPSVGRMPRSGNEITMDTASLKLLGIEPEPGAEVTLTYTVNQENAADEITDTFTLVGWWDYDSISPVHYINVSEEYVQGVEDTCTAAGMNPFRTDLNVMMASGVDIRGQMEQVDTDLGYTWEDRDAENCVRIGVNWGYTASQLLENVYVETIAAIAALLLLVIFTGYLIIYNIFQISVAGDIRFYGLLKTIGVTPRQLRRIIRLQALLLCVVGIPVGLLLGYGVGAWITPVVIANLDTVVTTVSASPLIFLGAALFSLITVLLSCHRPGKIAARVSPVEAAKYTENTQVKKTRRTTRGAKVHQMAFANLGRNRRKTVLVVISLSLSVVLLNLLATFTGGFDIEKYLEEETCADFIVSGTDYFRCVIKSDEYISQDAIDLMEANTTRTISGCGYTLSEATPVCDKREEADAMIEGLDENLFGKLTVIQGSLNPLFQKEHAIALAVYTDDYGNVSNLEDYPAIGSTQTITYIEDGYYIDARTGEKSDENTPEEYLEYYIAKSHDVDYTICAYVTVPYSMSYRYYMMDSYEFVLPATDLEADSGQEIIPMFYLFDTPDAAAEQKAEDYLAELTGGESSELMYESKATVRAEFENFQNMFLLLGSLLCAIIGLIGILNFFNAMMTSILARKREFAVLQAVGMTNRQLRSMLIYEGIFYALSTSFAVLILSLLLEPLAGNLMENMFWFFRYNFTIVPVLIAIPVFLLLGWLIPFVMYRQGTKQSVVERLREEG